MTEQHTPKFSGIWIPADIWNQFMAGGITKTELALLGIIESLVGDEGCYASNEYLADKLGSTSKSISNLIARLKAKGYIEQIKFDGRRRWLKTCWSRLSQTPPNGGPRVNHNTVESDCTTISKNTEKNKPAQNTSISREKEESMSEPVVPTDTVSFSFNSDGVNKFPASTKQAAVKQKKKPSPRHLEWAERLQAAVRSVNGSNGRSKAAEWANHFRLLEEHDGHEAALIERVVGWYCRELVKHQDDPYFPRALCGSSFRKKFEDKLLPRLRKKFHNPDREPVAPIPTTGWTDSE